MTRDVESHETVLASKTFISKVSLRTNKITNLETDNRNTIVSMHFPEVIYS